MVIDICLDHIPEKLFSDEALLARFMASLTPMHGDICYVGDANDGKKQIIIEKPAGCQNLNYVDGEYTLEYKLEAMDKYGVDAAVIRIPCWQEWLDLDTCKIVNDEAANLAARSGGRLYATTCVPPWNTKENIYELERCVKELGMHGVQLAAHYGELYLDHEAFRPFLRKAHELDVPVLVRHTPLPVDYKSIVDYNNVRRLLGRIIDQETAVARELYSDLFEELPNLKMIHTALGGGWFAIYDSLAPKGNKKETAGRLDTGVGNTIADRLVNNLYFEGTHIHTYGKKAIEAAINICGADHILFGSSYPVLENWMPDGVQFMETLDITEEERDLVKGGNAARLFKISL